MFDEELKLVEEYLALVKRIEAWDREYYMDNAPTVDDTVYDIEFARLRQLESEYPWLRHHNSPTGKVGGTVSKASIKAKHAFPMLSLLTDTSYGDEAITEFCKRIIAEDELLSGDDLLDYDSLIIEPKYDGMAGSVIFEYGVPVRVVTRGDGYIGEDISHFVIKHLLVKIDQLSQFKKAEVRGEFILNKGALDKINQVRTKEKSPLYVNARNAVAGILRSRSHSDEMLKAIIPECHLMPYGFYVDDKPFGKTYGEFIDTVFRLFTTHVCDTYMRSTVDSALQKVHHLKLIRDELPYEIDGVVIKANRYSVQEKLGYTGREPNWAIAHKFMPQTTATKIKSISLQVGRTGTITPVANLEPVLVGGVTVSNVNLVHQRRIEEYGIEVGDTVVIRRAGDVIPELVEVLAKGSGNHGYFNIMEHLNGKCPECGSPLVKEDDEEAIKCINNLGCRSQIVNTLAHIVSRQCFNINGIGFAKLDLLVKAKIIRCASDLFMLPKTNFKDNMLFGKVETANVLRELSRFVASEISLKLFITSLCISKVGPSKALAIAKRFKSYKAFTQASHDELMDVEGISDTIADNIINYFSSAAGEEADKLYDILNVMNYEGEASRDGEVYVITGSFKHFSREAIKDIIQATGAKVSSGVSRRTTALIQGEGGGGKINTATALKIPVWTEDDFMRAFDIEHDL